MMRGVFITGTDTGIGKTCVSAALLSILRARGIDAVPMKPVQTGCPAKRGTLGSPDLDFCLDAAGLGPPADEKLTMCPYRFKLPCSPHLAAGRAGRKISLSRIVTSFRQLTSMHDFAVVEGSGGILVPICGPQTMLDLMKKLGLPIILVARPGLGTINHTMLSLNALRLAGLEVLGVVFNESCPHGSAYIDRDNAATIGRLGRVRVLGRLPFAPDLKLISRTPDAFHRWSSGKIRVAFAD